LILFVVSFEHLRQKLYAVNIFQLQTTKI